MGSAETIIILIAVFVVFMIFMFLTWFFSHRARSRERLKLIEKGIDITKMGKESSYSFPWLKLGIVVSGIGTGPLIISILAVNDLLKGPGALPVSILSICGGISLIIANYVNKR